MEVFFGGVRGSIPTPGKEFMVYGGNTACRDKVNDHIIIFDMGSGIKNLGIACLKEKIDNFDIFVFIFIMIILVLPFLNLLIIHILALT